MPLLKSNTTFDPKPSSSIRPMAYPYIGFVKSNNDPQMMGRLGVWIPELCGDPTDQSSWILCSYCSPFAGASTLTELENYQDPNTQTVAQQSYGWVSVPPDVDTEVMVVFAGGDISRGYWIGCTYHQNMNHMVPGIAGDNTFSGQKTTDGVALTNPVPVIEYNKAGVTGSPNNVNRPVFQPLATGLTREGLMTDLERGLASTSMRRESPPLMSGWLSPRGNSVHIDDNAQNEFIRLRTRSGAQVLIHETTGYVYINSKNGNSWLEISDAGINGYTNSPLSFRATGDINLVSGGNINLDATGSINMRAGAQINLSAVTVQVGASGNLTMSAASAMNVSAGSNYVMSAGGTVSETSAGAWNRTGAPIQDNGGTSTAATVATAPAGKSLLDVTQVGNGGSVPTWTPGGGSYNTIASVLPTHEPWQGHPNANIPPIPVSQQPVPVTGSGTTTPAASSTDPSNPSSTANSGCSFGVAHTKPIDPVAFNAIQNASSVVGVDLATMLAIADQESSFATGAQASTSSAQGLYQFINSTWIATLQQYGATYNVSLTAQRSDPVACSLMGAAFIKQNMQTLSSKGYATTPGNIYLLHFLGGGGGIQLLSANANSPSTSAASLFPGPANSNPTIFFTKDGNRTPQPVSYVYNYLTNLINSKAQAYASQKGLPAPCSRVQGTAPPTGGPSSGTAPGVSHTIDPNNPITSAQKLVGRYLWKPGVTSPANQQQCVALVQEVCNLGHTGTWRRGQTNLSSNPPTPGTGIATFDSQGQYHGVPGKGTTHACVYLAPADSGNGIKVLEQYTGSPAHIRDYQNGATTNYESDARNYCVINIA